MMKKMILLLGLILGICNLGVTAFAEESQVEVQIQTHSEDGKLWEGTEALELAVYDLTDWRTKRAGYEKSDKEFILNTYSTKEKLAAFVKEAQLPKINQAPFLVDGNGQATMSLPRYQQERDGAYLILSSGETGKYQMLPIIVYLPQTIEGSSQESTTLVFYSKYREISTELPTKPTTPSVSDSSEPEENRPIGTPNDEGGTKSYPGKELPSTNELIRNYCFLGLLLMIVGFIGLNKNKEEKNDEK